MLPSFMIEDEKVKHIAAMWLPAPVMANVDFTKQHSSIRKDILYKVSTLKATKTRFDLEYSASVTTFLSETHDIFMEEAKQQLSVLVDEYLPIYRVKPYETSYLQRILDETTFTISSAIHELIQVGIIPDDKDLLAGIQTTARSIDTLDFFREFGEPNCMTIRSWTLGSTILDFLKRISNYTHQDYNFPLGSSLPVKLLSYFL